MIVVALGALALLAVGIVVGLAIAFIAWSLSKEDEYLNDKQER